MPIRRREGGLLLEVAIVLRTRIRSSGLRDCSAVAADSDLIGRATLAPPIEVGRERQ